MAKKKGITQSQDAAGRPGSGSLLAELASGHLMRTPEPVSLSPEEDAEIFMRAARTALLPGKVAKLKSEIADVKRAMAAMEQASKSIGKCPLWDYVREAKKRARKKCPYKVSDQAFIARFVDIMLKSDKKTFRLVCPVSWKKVQNLPQTLESALQHPELKGRVKTFISKVKVV